MKKCIRILFFLLASSPIGLTACPTCVGRVNQESPPFFSDEFYKPDEQGMDELYEKLLCEQAESVEKSISEPKKEGGSQ